MKIVFRWFGDDNDNVKLEYIRQIPGVTGIAGALYDVPVGEVWPREKIEALKRRVNGVGLEFEVIESVNVHEDIKLGVPSRERYIDNYIESIRNLADAGVKVICYNFMPIFDWVRTSLNMPLPDGSNTMAYDDSVLNGLSPDELVRIIGEESHGFTLPGWQPDRLADLKKLFDAYKGIDENTLRENLGYFLRRIIPFCEEVGIKMAIHPDDPSWSLFGLPRIVKNEEDIERLLNLCDSPANGIALCTGSLGANRKNDVPALIKRFASRGRIPFIHVRNLKFDGEGRFHETSHPTSEGSFDMFAIMKALYDSGFDGYLRPDHGRMIWGEEGRPGYGLYDRALGITYLTGLWEAISRMS